MRQKSYMDPYIDENWAQVHEVADDRLRTLGDEDFLALTGLARSVAEKVFDEAVRQWRISPSRSLLNLLHAAKAGRKGRMMEDKLTQTRLLKLLQTERNLPGLSARDYRDESGKIAQVGGSRALKIADGDEATNRHINNVARALHIVSRMRSSAEPKPKERVVYRGIRCGDIKLPQDLIEELNRIDYPSGEHRGAAFTQARADLLRSHPFRQLCQQPLYSFTDKKAVAAKFANNRGLVISVPVDLCEVITNHHTCEQLDVTDPILKIKEREWILSLPDDLTLGADQVEIFNLDNWFITGDIRGIRALDGFAQASYMMNDMVIDANFHWNASGRGGSITFNTTALPYGHGRGSFRKALGFDPIPSSPDQVEWIRYRKCHPHLSRSHPVLYEGPPAGAELRPASPSL